MTSKLKFTTMQHAAARVSKAQEEIFREFEHEHYSIKAITFLLYVDKRSGAEFQVSAQAVLRDQAIPSHVTAAIIRDQLKRIEGHEAFDEVVHFQILPDEQKGNE